jgi:hypothetical protein
VIFAFVYAPGVTVVFARVMLGVVPPEDARGTDAVTAVTPPPPPVAEIVISPVVEERVTPAPAVSERTPVFVITTLPVAAETLMPKPALTSVTPPPPVALMVLVA